MKIQYCSGLHLEFPKNRRWLEANPLILSAEVLAIAGDCFYLGDDYRQYDFILRVADEFEVVYILPGNHEYYGGYDAATAMHTTTCPARSATTSSLNCFSLSMSRLLGGKPGNTTPSWREKPALNFPPYSAA